MICPVDKTQLVITDREGVEIDYCPTCRGVWLDRGEIEKISARMQQYESRDRGGENYHREERYDDRDRRHHDDDDDDDDRRRYDSHGGHHDGKRHHKKESFIGDLFDF